MKPKQPLNLSDLIRLDGLKKSEKGELTVELGTNPEKVKKLQEGMTDLAGKMEDNKDVKTGELASLVEAMKNALVRELSPEKSGALLKTLKTRFQNKKKPYKPEAGMNWEDIQTRLEANPEKLWSLNEMERTGGEPDVMSYDKKTGEYIFMDCSAESPTGRRNCVYDREGEKELKEKYPDETCNSNAVSMAVLMGVDLLNEKEYRALQTKGEFDKNSWSWIKTPIDKRKAGVALHGFRSRVDVYVREYSPRDPNVNRGWRAALRVK